MSGIKPLEVRLMENVLPSHRSILRFHYWCFINTTAGEGLEVYYEYCAGKTLESFIPEGQPGSQSEGFIWHVFIQLAEALDAMHHRGTQHVVHRDVKPSNVFLKTAYRPGHAFPTVKLGDYGLATTKAHSTGCGTWEWIGPEIALSSRGDVWALGAIIHALCHGVGPVDMSRRGWKRNPDARRPRSLPARYSDCLNDNMMFCLRRNPRDRVSSDELVRSLHRDRPRAR